LFSQPVFNNAAGAVNTLGWATIGVTGAGYAPALAETAAQGIGRAAAWRASSVVLGRYPTYVNLAEEVGARALNLPGPIAKGLSAAGLWWTTNQAFLDQAMSNGARFFLASGAEQIGTGYYQLELQYLQMNGYVIPW
jgi:hypothetical protein